MKWFKRLLVLLVALLLGSAIILTAALFLLEEADYKHLLTWGAEQFLDNQLVIEGPIRIDLSRNLSLTTGDILLKANDNSYRLTVGKLQTNFRLGSYLQTGTFWFNSLELTDVNLEISETTDDEFKLEDIYIPPVVVARAQFNNLNLTYRELPPGTLHTFSLDELTIDELGEHQPVSLRAVGQLEGQSFVLEGTSGSFAELVEHRQSHSVQLKLSSAHANVSVQGMIDDPVNGRGLNLQIQADIPQVRELVEIFWDEIPVLGSLQGSLNIQGDYSAPRLEAIDLHLQRDQEVNLTIRGSVSDPLTGSGLNLQVDGQSNHPEVLSWLAFKKHDRMQAIQVSGKLQGDAAQLSLDNIDVSAETTDGLKLQLNGNTVIAPAGHRLTSADAGLVVAFSAPTLAAANLVGLENLPALGPVSGSLSLALGRAAVGIYKTDVSIGQRSNGQFRFKGDVGYVPLSDKPGLSELSLDTDIQAVELARLAEPFGHTLPELGQTRISGKLQTSKSGWLFRDASLVIGDANEPSILATGKVTTHRLKGSTVVATIDLGIAELYAAFNDHVPGIAGRLQGNVKLTSPDGHWGVEKFSLTSTGTPLYQLDLNGSINDLLNQDGARIHSDLVIKRPAKLANILGINLVGIPPSRTQGLLRIDKGNITYQGETTLGSTHSKTTISGRIGDDKPVLRGNIEIPVLHLADVGLDAPATPVTAESAGDKPATPRVFSREPLNIDFMNHFDLELAVAIAEVKGRELVIDSVTGNLRLNNGHLSITPLRLLFAGGEATVDLDINAKEIPEYRLAITADDLTLGPLMSQVQNLVPIRGYSNVHLDLHSRGRTPHEMASNLSGNVSLGIENARIPRHYVDLLSVDVFGWVLSKSSIMQQQQHMNLNCLVVTFAVNAGSVKSETLIADGPRLSLGGQINMDLGQETLDIVLIPKQKKSIFSSISPVTVAGPMKNPEVTAIPVKAALKEIGAMALLPGVVISTRAVGKLWSLLDDGDTIGDGCTEFAELGAAAKSEAAGTTTFEESPE